MNVFDDICRLVSFESNPLIPYIKKDKFQYKIYYLFVHFSDIEDGKVNITKIAHIGCRDGERLNYNQINKVFVEPYSIKFENEKKELYEDKSEHYCNLISEGKFEEALELYHSLVPNEFTILYEEIIRGVYE